MKVLRAAMACVLILGLSAQALAGDLQASAAKAVADDAQAKTSKDQFKGGASRNTLMWTGAAMFVGGMAVGLYGFINDKNGEFSEFGEAESSNKALGGAGLAVAFGGGALMFLGSRRSKFAPSVSAGPRGVTVSKRITW